MFDHSVSSLISEMTVSSVKIDNFWILMKNEQWRECSPMPYSLAAYWHTRVYTKLTPVNTFLRQV